MQTLHVVDEHVSDVGLGLGNRRRRPPLRPHTAVRTSEGPRTRPPPEQGRLRPGAASTHGNVGRPTHRNPADGPPASCDLRTGPSGPARGRQPIRGASRQVLDARNDIRNGSLPPHGLHRRLLRRGLLLHGAAALHALTHAYQNATNKWPKPHCKRIEYNLIESNRFR